MTNINHDIIIAGAGPAGSVAAAFLVRAGHDVLLIDQYEFPRDKICGDAIGPFALRILHEIGLKDPLDGAGCYPITSGRIVSPSGHSISLKFSDNHPDQITTLVAPRKQLDGLVQNRAIQLGATFMQAKVLDVEQSDKGDVIIKVRDNQSEKTLSSRLLLAADGSNSIIARKLNGQYPATHLAVAARAYVKGIYIRENTIEGFLDSSIWPGYGWIFPIGPNEANIGVGLSMKAFRKMNVTLRQVFDLFLSTPEIKERLSSVASVESYAGWPLRLGWDRKLQRVWDGVILLGDAAGLINPLSGGGIANAMFSAKVAAEVAIEALDSNDFSMKSLSSYESRIRKVIHKELIQSEWLRRLIYNSPGLVDRSVRLLRNHRVLPALLSRLYTDLQFTIN
ncbi:geranylgeranyl reductase family protein [candidate division KSB1 bacterium]|nr:geranylgeranyl reductase family protein [candidate division KSB1 bacterium]